MKYFYLTPDKQPRGPHSAAELRALHASGAIHDDTYTAAAGDAAWRPYREQTLTDDGAPAFEPQTLEPHVLGACPFCEKDIEGVSSPAVCPHCGKTLHPGNNSNLWVNFVSCMRRYACFRGRATRTEFWSFYLFSFIIEFAVSLIWELVAAFGMGVSFDWGSELILGGSPFAHTNVVGFLIGTAFFKYVFPLVFLIPLWSVLARRLHDIGHNLTGLILYICGNVLSLIGTLGLVSLFIFYFTGADAGTWNASTYLRLHAISLMTSAIMLMLGSLITLGTGIYLFVACLLPSKRGANKYGPSVL